LKTNTFITRAARACDGYAALVVETTGQFADDDPEYEADAAADIDLEVAEFELADPKKIPKDEGDAGTAEPPGGSD
jgi:hypothetical protein